MMNLSGINPFTYGLYFFNCVTTPQILIDHQALDELEIPVFIKNTDGIYVYCNQAFIDFLGLSKDKILGHTAYDIAPKKLAEVYEKADKELFAAEKKQTYNSIVSAANEIETTVAFSKAILHTPDHKIAGFIGSVHVNNSTHGSDSSQLIQKLTPREIDVLSLLAQGNSVKAIAARLGISPHTATHYLKSIYAKLDVHSKNEALYKALALFTMRPP